MWTISIGRERHADRSHSWAIQIMMEFLYRNIEVPWTSAVYLLVTSVTDYVAAWITVRNRRFRNRVRIVVPNCADIDLVMWVSCLNTTFWSSSSTNENEIIIFHATLSTCRIFKCLIGFVVTVCCCFYNYHYPHYDELFTAAWCTGIWSYPRSLHWVL